jgi:SAM-dependent methyltransferase
MPEYADSSRTRDETPHERHERWAWIHETAAMTGWDFSPLAGRLVADDPPWDFDQICLDAMAESSRCLDMGTGGGERLSELIDRLDEARPPGEPSPTISAAEGWEPNVPLAASTLQDYGVEVTRYDSDHHPEMPWGDGEFDLVMNRHESYDLAEVARVLAPGGLFLTQQVDGTEAQEFRDLFGGGVGNLASAARTLPQRCRKSGPVDRGGSQMAGHDALHRRRGGHRVPRLYSVGCSRVRSQVQSRCPQAPGRIE